MLLSSFLLLGCGGGFHVEPVMPTAGPGSVLAPGAIAAVQVVTTELAPDKLRMLDKFDVPGTVQRTLTDSLGQGGYLDASAPLRVEVYLNEFRNPKYGPAFLGALVRVVDANGQPVKQLEVREQTSRMVSRTSRLGIITQGVVTQVAQQL